MAASVDLWRAAQRARAAPPDQIPDAISMAKEADTLPMRNNQGGSAPELVLMKRVEQPMTFSDLIKRADALIRSGDYSGAYEALERADRLISKHSVHVHMNGNGDSWDDEDDEDNDDFDSPSDTSMEKASEHYRYPHYGATPSPATPSGHGRGPDQTSDPYATGSNPTGGAPTRTRFDTKVDEIQERDGVSRHIAMSTARLEAPKLYMEHQNSLSEAPTRNQHRCGTGQANKSAPTFWEDCVSAELAKGASTMEVASQRAAQQFGYDAFNNRMLAKGSQNIEARFKNIVKRIADTEGCGLETATREARLRNPTLVKAMNST
jgi:hypothetical protein